MSVFEIVAVSFLSGAMAAMGLGGGMILTVYLTVFAGMSQLAAQGINLVFFLPIAAVSLVFHMRNHLTELKKAAPMIISGAASSIVFSLLAVYIKSEYLSKAFGVFLIVIGVKILFEKKKQAK